LGQSTRGLRPRIGIVKLHQQLPLLDSIAFLHEHSSDRGCDWSVCLKTLQRFHFSVGGYDAANLPLFYTRNPNGDRILSHGNEGAQQQNRDGDAHDPYQPATLVVKVRSVHFCSQASREQCTTGDRLSSI
jgi:hypothetical protein